MDLRTFFLSGLAGGLVDYILGYLFYGLIFPAYFVDEVPNLPFILMGCLTYGFLISYLFTRWANLTTYTAGLKLGSVLGLGIGLMNNFFSKSISSNVDYECFGLDVLIETVMGAIVGAIVAEINGALTDG